MTEEQYKAFAALLDGFELAVHVSPEAYPDLSLHGSMAAGALRRWAAGRGIDVTTRAMGGPSSMLCVRLGSVFVANIVVHLLGEDTAEAA